jgi:PAS domain S-box-containing protein
VAFALLLRPRRRVVFIVGLAVVSAVANAVAGRPVEVSALFGLANASEVVVVTWLLTRSGRPPRLANVDDLVRLLVAAVVGALAVATIAGVTVAMFSGGSFLVTLRAVLASHAAAVLVLAPLGMRLSRTAPRLPTFEHVGQWVLTVVVLAVIFAPEQRLSLVFLVFLPLLWGALRFSTREISVQLMVVGGCASLASAQGWGPLALAATGNHPPEIVGSLVQTFLASSALLTYGQSVVTAQRREALAEAVATRRNLSSVLAAASRTSIIGTDLTGRVVVFNPGAENLLGYSAAEVVGTASLCDFHDPAELAARGRELDTDACLDVLVHHLRDGSEAERRDWTYVRADGEGRLVSVTMSAVLGATGDITGYLGVAHDVTERRRSEELLREALAKETEVAEALREAARLKSDFVSSVIHELRTPMTSVLGYAELLSEGDAGELTAEQAGLLRRIRAGGTRMLSLVENLLTLSRIEAGTWTLARSTFDLEAPIGRAVELADLSARADGVLLAAEGSAAGLSLTGDAVEIERMVSNLLSNAVKFTQPGGRVTLEVTEDEGWARICVRDEGIGIPEEDCGRLFERFFRASNAQAQAVPGTGLGLSIVRAIVERHGGSIDVESQLGVGTTFHVALPLTRHASAAAAPVRVHSS